MQTIAKQPSLNKPKPFAEVVQSSLASFTAQSWKWNVFPSFASLVTVEHDNQTLLGLVSNMSTGSSDPMRYPFPYQKTEAELAAEQPQIFEFLRTTFDVTIVGSQIKTSIRYLVPSKPCKIHSFVHPAPLSLVKTFFSKTDFMHLLFSCPNQQINIDELLLCLIDRLAHIDVLTPKVVEDYYQTFSLLTGNDYRRLKIFLNRAQHALKS